MLQLSPPPTVPTAFCVSVIHDAWKPSLDGISTEYEMSHQHSKIFINLWTNVGSCDEHKFNLYSTNSKNANEI